MTTEPSRPGHSTKQQYIVLRPWPKVVFFYPTMLAAFAVALWQYLTGPALNETAGLVFFVIAGFNLLIISFEFTRMKTVAILFAILALFFLLLYLGTKFEVLDFLRQWLAALHIAASTPAYIVIGVFLFVVFLGVIVNTRWDYYEVRHNEIVHHTGFLGDIRRFPSPNLKVTKEINDVFEFLLLRSGRIILYPTSEREPIILEGIISVNTVEEEMKKLLASLAVEMTHHDPIRDSEPGIM